MPQRAQDHPTEAPPHTPLSETAGRGWRPAARLVALVVLLLVSVLYAVSHMDQGIDTWISLAGGRDVVAHGVRDADPFSFQSRPPHPASASAAARLSHWLQPNGWINQNWLTHVLLFTLLRAGGGDALVIWKLANYILVALVLIATAHELGAGWEWGGPAAVAALVASRDYLSIRAQDVTNLMLAVLLLLLALADRRDRRWVWALVPLFAVWANAHGGFVYGFVVIAVVIASDWQRSKQKHTSSVERRRQLLPLVTAGGLALVAAAAASPYRLANLTHPLVITISADAPQWRVVREWKPLFSNPLASPYPFLAFAAVTIAALLAHSRLAAGGAGDRFVATGVRVVVVSFALAVTSGRFVPVACVVAAPFLAVWLHGAAAAVIRRGPLAAHSRRRLLRTLSDAALAVAAVAAAVAVLPRAARTYLGPWTQDARRTGLFDRMTFTHQRPWGPCAFLAANGVSGRAWNFWDEGGFLAYCQPADAATGKVPVEIFIDGRAQAAYEVGALASYLDLLNGPGRTPQGGQDPASVADLASLRAWTRDRLTALGVWIALVPAARQNTALARAVVGIPGWKLVYVDPEHSLFVDTADSHGRSLEELVAAGAARYPDEASAKLTAAFRLLPPADEEAQARAVRLAIEAYRAEPTQLAVLCAGRAARAAGPRAEALRFCQRAAEEFVAQRDSLRRRDGYSVRLSAATTAFAYVASEASKARVEKLAMWAASWHDICAAEEQALARRVLW